VRQKLNENPLVQAGLVGLLALVVGFLLITRMGGGGSSSAAPADTTETAAATAPAPSAEPSEPAASAAAVPPATTDSRASEFVAGPGLPAKVADAYDAGETVVLLIVHRSGVDDRKLESEIDSATGVGDTEVILVEDKDIADYSRIAEGVDVDRVPALLVIQPKSLAEGPLPEASVSYGYRGPQSIAQTVRDALYKGRDDLPYYP
jgi:hypothetical protein